MELAEASEDIKQELDIVARYNIAVEWVKAAREIADKTNNETARQLLDFIEDQTTLGVPMPGGYVDYFFIDRDPDRPISEYAFLTPIIDKDIDRLPPEDDRLKFFAGGRNAIAHYSEGSRGMYLLSNNLSKTSVGILLLHEAAHAWLDIEGRIDRNYPEGHWLEEADIYEFEFELLSALGGEVYQKVLEALTDSIRPLEDRPDTLSTHNEMTDDEKAQFAEALGLSSKQEISTWLSICAFNAFFEYIKKHSADPRHEFAMFLKGWHHPHE